MIYMPSGLGQGWGREGGCGLHVAIQCYMLWQSVWQASDLAAHSCATYNIESRPMGSMSFQNHFHFKRHLMRNHTYKLNVLSILLVQDFARLQTRAVRARWAFPPGTLQLSLACGLRGLPTLSHSIQRAAIAAPRKPPRPIPGPTNFKTQHPTRTAHSYCHIATIAMKKITLLWTVKHFGWWM